MEANLPKEWMGDTNMITVYYNHKWFWKLYFVAQLFQLIGSILPEAK